MLGLRVDHVRLDAPLSAPAAATIFTQEEAIIIPAFVIFGLLAFAVVTYLVLRMALAGVFLVDRDTGIVESFRLSDYFMAGNKLTTFLLIIVTGIISVIAVAVTCCVGIVIVAPFMNGVLTPVIYIRATGQQTHDSKSEIA